VTRHQAIAWAEKRGAPWDGKRAPRDTATTLYVRMPSSLKAAIDRAAKAAGLSSNVWAAQQLERALHHRPALRRFTAAELAAEKKRLAAAHPDMTDAELEENAMEICAMP
jgi:hypothetical protein